MPDRLRVASIYSNMIIGGDQNRLLGYLAVHDADRFEHTVIAGTQGSPDLESLCGPILERFRSVDVDTIDLGVPAPYLRWKKKSALSRNIDQARVFTQLVRRTATILRQKNIDIVDGRCDMGTLLATLAGRIAGVRGIISTNYFPQLERFKTPGWSFVGRSTYALVDAVVCDSMACLDAMRKWMTLPPPGYCIPNGIAVPRPERARDEMLKQLSIPDNATVVGQIARIQPYKGQDILLQAAPLILAKHPNVYFLVCGYTGYTQRASDYRVQLDRIVEKHGLGDRVRIVSYPGNIGDIWPLVDIHVHPTLHDSSPIALLESMSLGKPSVTTSIGGISELVLDGDTGFVLPPRDKAALCRAIQILLDNPDKAARMGQRAKKRYGSNYRPELMAERIEALYERVYTAPRMRKKSTQVSFPVPE